MLIDVARYCDYDYVMYDYDDEHSIHFTHWYIHIFDYQV